MELLYCPFGWLCWSNISAPCTYKPFAW